MLKQGAMCFQIVKEARLLNQRNAHVLSGITADILNSSPGFPRFQYGELVRVAYYS